MKLSPEVSDVLKRSTVTGTQLTLPEQLPRKLYVEVAKVLELIGGTWSRKAKCHVFADDAADVVADAIATGAVVDFKKEYQFYETPADICAQLVDLADLPPEDLAENARLRVCEPSAGRGAIVCELRKRGVEPAVCELWTINGDYLVNTLHAKVVAKDFLTHEFYYDRFVMNPPFTRGQDVAHVLHAYRWLAPGGCVASVMSPGWRFKQDKQSLQLREGIYKGRPRNRWIELPPGSFKCSGTNVNTGILVLHKEG